MLDFVVCMLVVFVVDADIQLIVWLWPNKRVDNCAKTAEAAVDLHGISS
jgi:hypothetical protein